MMEEETDTGGYIRTLPREKGLSLSEETQDKPSA